MRKSELYQKILNKDDPLIVPPHFIIGDCGYPLLEELLTPFEDTENLNSQQMTFNLRFNSIRSTIDSAFGMLKGKWKRLKYLDMSDIHLINNIIQGCCVLHNFILMNAKPEKDEDSVIDYNPIVTRTIFISIPDIEANEKERHAQGESKRNLIMSQLK